MVKGYLTEGAIEVFTALAFLRVAISQIIPWNRFEANV